MEAQVPPYSIEPLDSAHDRAAFSCGIEALDRYLRYQAGQDVRRRVAATFVLEGRNSQEVVGYYTLSAASIHTGDLPDEIAKKLPKYPALPATLVGRLAVDQRYRGQGLGEFLLMDALYRSLENTKVVASVAVVVDAKDQVARNFYVRYGFIQFPESSNRLFLPMKTIAQLFP